MSGTVLDASVFVAVISPSEIHHQAARDLWRGYPAERPFLVPALFRVEVIAALARREEPVEFLDTVDLLVSGPRFHAISMDGELIERAAGVARGARLRAYDSVYVALALIRDAAFVSLDREVRSKVARAFPRLKLNRW